MKIVLAAGAVLAVLGAGGLTGSALTAASERSPVADDAPQGATDEPTGDVDDADDTDEQSGKPDDEEKSARHAAQRAFVAAKQEWTACVGGAAPAHEPGSGPFDPEDACGAKPHPDDEAPGRSADKHEQDQGRPAWAGGPDRRTAEPPGHAQRDQASAGR